MYKTDDYIVKKGHGVCRVGNVTYLDMDGIDRNRLYYMLVPIRDEHYLALAENLLFPELCLALEKNKEEVHHLIV